MNNQPERLTSAARMPLKRIESSKVANQSQGQNTRLYDAESTNTDRWITAYAIARGYLHDLGETTRSEKTLKWCQAAQQKHGFKFVGSRPHLADLPIEVLEEFGRSLSAAFVRGAVKRG